MDKIRLKIPVIVEGKYDKAALSSIVQAPIITTDGFGIFSSKEKRALIKQLSQNGIIVLCDSDSAGGVIRSHIKGLIPQDKLYQLYVPRIEGTERRKKSPSKEGILGVEGIDVRILYSVFQQFTEKNPEVVCNPNDNNKRAAAGADKITKTDFFLYGFSGGVNSSGLRNSLAVQFGLPPGMTANALLSALNIIISRDDFLNAAEKIKADSLKE